MDKYSTYAKLRENEREGIDLEFASPGRDVSRDQ